MAWLTLVIGGVILVIGVLGQFLGVRRGPRSHPEDRRMGRLVLTVGSTVVGLWLVFIAAAHAMHWQVIGRW